MIPYGHQSISSDDIDAVVDILRSDFLTQGPKVPAFEKAVCDYTTSNYAIAVNSGTSALHLACLALGLGESDVLWTSPITFVASANCARYCGAAVDFVDIDPDTFTISIPALEKKLAQAEKEGKLPKILIPVHLAGVSCDMRAIKKLADQYNCYIIEDGCHAIGGKYDSSLIGSCFYSDITIFSFHPVKTITTGEGGLATTNDKQLYSRMEQLRSHGITRDVHIMEQQPDGPWYYEQQDLGFNFRMTDIQAALGICQLNKLDGFVSRRHDIAKYYCELLTGLPVKIQSIPKNCYSGLHLLLIRLDIDKINKTQKNIFKEMIEAGIGVNVHYIPVHLQPYYLKLGFKRGDFPEAEEYYSEAMTLPLYPELKNEQVELITSTLANVIHSG